MHSPGVSCSPPSLLRPGPRLGEKRPRLSHPPGNGRDRRPSRPPNLPLRPAGMGPEKLALGLWALAGFSAPFFFYSIHVYPEIVVALLGLAAFRWLRFCVRSDGGASPSSASPSLRSSGSMPSNISSSKHPCSPSPSGWSGKTAGSRAGSPASRVSSSPQRSCSPCIFSFKTPSTDRSIPRPYPGRGQWTENNLWAFSRTS